jgi:hypothetical protein
MFDELDYRDPERARDVVVLLDGDEHQQTAILDEGRRHERKLTIVLDIIHMVHYLWLAGFALCHKNRADRRLDDSPPADGALSPSRISSRRSS